MVCPLRRLASLCILVTAACGTPPPATVPAAGDTASPTVAPQPPSPIASSTMPATTTAPSASAAPVSTAAAPSFADDLAFLRGRGEVIVLRTPSGGLVAVSPTYQGRVMTSAVSEAGASLGWIHRSFIEAGKTGTPFDNYGGEDRFWLGPEGGQFGLYFAPGKPFQFDAWQTPSAFQAGSWVVKEQGPTRVAFERAMELENHSGARFKLAVAREISALGPAELKSHLRVEAPAGVAWVGFQSDNRITNTGVAPWNDRTGLLSVWILAMFPPADDTFVVVPFERQAKGPIVNDSYFGKVPADRLQVREDLGVLVFKCDGKHRSKIGLPPPRAPSLLGSYSASSRLLTIVQYDKPKAATRYVNSMWELQKEPFGGDVVNSYNDGPTEPGKPALGGFYEMESSSPAAALAPKQSLRHVHRTFHFTGEPAALDALAKQVLGVEITKLGPPR